MADLTVTAGNVALSTPVATYSRVTFGEAVTQGQSVYLKESDNRWWKADSNVSDEASGSLGLGVALTKGGAGDFGIVITAGKYVSGATMTQGTDYYVSNTAGGIAPKADLASGSRVSFLGTATSATILNLKPFASLALVP